MIPEAREVRLRRNDRKVLEARCRSPVTLQRDLKRARIVTDGRSTRSIAMEVGVQPRIVSLWRHRYAEQGLEGLEDKPRPGKQSIYTKATDKRILGLLDKPPPEGFVRWTGPLLAQALGDVDVQYVWRFLRRHKIDLVARKSWCESNDPDFTAKAADVVGLYVAPPEKAIVLALTKSPRSRRWSVRKARADDRRSTNARLYRHRVRQPGDDLYQPRAPSPVVLASQYLAPCLVHRRSADRLDVGGRRHCNDAFTGMGGGLHVCRCGHVRGRPGFGEGAGFATPSNHLGPAS
jgi:transposase